MAIITNTFTTFTAIGNREQLSDTIWDISPTETPFMSSIGRASTNGTYVEWQTDALASAADNAVVQGNDHSTTFTAVTPTTRVGNRTQISEKDFLVSGTQEAVEKAGRRSDIAYQVAKKGKELKRDMEVALTGNYASTSGDASSAPHLGGYEAWIAGNSSRNAGAGGSGTGADGGFSNGNISAATDGTQRTFTEAMLKTVHQACWTDGGDPRLLIVGPHNKGVASGFSGISTQYTRTPEMDQAKIIGGADVYVGDFGVINIVADRFSRDRSAMLVDTEYWQTVFLRPFKVHKLAKTGDAEKRLLNVEYTLCAKNQNSSGVIADLLTS